MATASRTRQRGFSSPDTGAVIIEFLDRGDAFFCQHLGARKPPLRGIQFTGPLPDNRLRGHRVALSCNNLGVRARHRVDRLLRFGASLVSLRVKDVHLHLGQGLSSVNEVPFVHGDRHDTSGKLGGHVDLGRFDTAVAADKTDSGTGRSQCNPEDGRDHGRCDRCQNNYLLHLGSHDGPPDFLVL